MSYLRKIIPNITLGSLKHLFVGLLLKSIICAVANERCKISCAIPCRSIVSWCVKLLGRCQLTKPCRRVTESQPSLHCYICRKITLDSTHSARHWCQKLISITTVRGRKRETSTPCHAMAAKNTSKASVNSWTMTRWMTFSVTWCDWSNRRLNGRASVMNLPENAVGLINLHAGPQSSSKWGARAYLFGGFNGLAVTIDQPSEWRGAVEWIFAWNIDRCSGRYSTGQALSSRSCSRRICSSNWSEFQ